MRLILIYIARLLPSRTRMEPRQQHILLATLLTAATCGAAPAAAQQPPARETQAELPAQQIVGRRQSGQYNADGSEGATKTDTPLLETPQSVRVVTRQLMDDLGALRLDDMLDYVAGASRQNNFGGTWDNLAMRGFAGHEDTGMMLMRNGMPANRGFNAPRDSANLERVEFLKGTMGAIYGRSEPGGTVNLVTKAPSFTRGHSLEAYAGSYDYRRLAFDSTGPLDGSGEDPATLAYRLNVSAEDKDSFRDHVNSRRELVAPALTWKLTPDTTLRYDGEWLRQRAPLDRGVVAVGGQLGLVPISRYYGEPADGDTTLVNHTHQWLVEHFLSPQWQLRAGLQHKRGTVSGQSSEAHQYGPAATGCPTSVEASGWLCRRLRERSFASRETLAQLETVGRFQAAGLDHQLLLGLEAARYSIDQRMAMQPSTGFFSYGIDVFAPVYGAPRPALTVLSMDRRLSDRTGALYAQDEVSLAPDWKLLVGLRHDRYDGEIDDHLRTRTEQSSSATSPRIGLTWLPAQNWSLYASAGRSFRPQTNTNAAGETLPPETGTAHELGAKWQSADGRLGASLAVFDIRKRNMTQYDVNGNYLVPLSGTVRNKGAELELAGWVAAGWRVAASYAWLDTDERITQFARHSGSVFVVHELRLADRLAGVGGGFTHVGQRRGDTGEPVLPAYTVAKLTGYWNPTAQLRVSLDVDNLFDKTYYTSAYNRVWVTPGSPRTVMAGLQYKF
jgi:iron complex outermembrane receptor protein